ncbi:MAG: amino acid adenylation domain-containing protein [Acidobacteriota bacterium]
MAVPRSFRSLVELLRLRAEKQPSQNAYTFLADGEVESALWTYGDLDSAARAIAARLQELTAPGDRALLLYPAGLDFVAAFFGCLYANVIAVPAYPPRRHRVQQRLRSIVEDCQPTVCLTTGSVAERATVLSEQSTALAAARWLATDHLPEAATTGDWAPTDPGPVTPAFLQYTSGSTGDPKGVIVSHANLLHNEEMIHRAFGMTSESVVVGWLPLYHDMGLIGNVLQPLYAGGRCVLMSPMAFLQKPLRWLTAIDRYRGTTSGGPNFAYELCADRVSAHELEELDLSCWKVAFNGAEPVRASTLDRFATTFAPCGFNRQAFYPCYGLAETTLFVTGGEPGQGAVVDAFDTGELENHRAAKSDESDDGARQLVGSGRAWLGQDVAIVSDRKRLDEGRIGEIWVAGPSVAGGYWQRPERTHADFEARLDRDPEAGPFLRTGDLGFLRDGELFVTGRLKDLIILRGRNLYPHDLELTASASHPSLRPGNAIAFAVDDQDKESLVLVLEVERRVVREKDPAVCESLVAAVRRAIAAEHEAAVGTVVLIYPGTLPKTSSGKVRRRACRQQYLAGELRTVTESPLASLAEQLDETADTSLDRATLLALADGPRRTVFVKHLQRVVARRLGVPLEQVPADTALTSLGLDSLHAMELQGRLERELNVTPDLAALLEGASIEDLTSELLDQLANARGKTIPVTGEVLGKHVLSFGQRALWFLHRLAPDSAAYNIAAGARIHGALDTDALQRAFERVVARHPMLRARFRDPEGEPVQEILPESSGRLTFRLVDASEKREDWVQSLLDEEARRPFDLTCDALLRIHLLQRATEEHLLLLVVHHMVADFWSISILLEEIGEIYRAETGGPAAALPPLPLAYADFARWQSSQLAGEDGQRLESYWRERLAGDLEPLDLATDRPRPPVQTWHGASASTRLPPAIVERASRLAESHGTTFYMTLLACFQALLHRYTGQVDLAVGSPTAGRGRRELEGLVGYFVNPVVMRADLAGLPTFAAFLERTRLGVLDAFRHQAYPFDLLVERLQPIRRSNRHPIFQVLFTLQQAPRLREEGLDAFTLGQGDGESSFRLSLGGLEWQPLDVDTGAAQFELALAAAIAPAGLVLKLTYNRDLFEATTVERLLGHLERLVVAAVDTPITCVSDLPLLTEVERRQILVDWNTPRHTIGTKLNLYQRVAAQAAQTPRAVALVNGDLELEYGELLRRAGWVAQRLRQLGVAAEEPVGVCLERSPEMIIGLLGVLAAGGCYVPLDPAYPQDRLTYMFEDVTTGRERRLLLTRLADRERLGALADLASEILTVEDSLEAAAPNDAAVDEAVANAHPGQLAYVIYTSGSTGRPKGVAIPHAAVVNFLDSMRGVPGLGPQDALLAVTTLAFDIAVLEIFLPLTVGARLVLASPQAPTDGTLLGAEIERHDVTAMQATPATWRLLLESGWRPTNQLVRMCGGEALPADLAAGMLTQGGTLWNMYGPTETTIWSAVRRVEPGEAPVKVGGPIANTRLHVLDDGLEAVPIGVPGEMWIAGDGLARGYCGRPRLTAERFVPDSFAAELGAAGDRLYQVGDRVRWLPDGTFEFLGRVDQQVKVRGYRIELGEIEAALGALPAVAQGVVVVRADNPADPRLVAFLQAAAGSVPQDTELRTALRQGLPDYMVPAVFVWIDEFPQTPNGKIDRKALIRRPLPRAAGSEQRLPRSVVERQLAELWCEVLGVESVGMDDNFFDVGGHSLLAARLHRLIVDRLGHDELTVVHLFQYPTLNALAGFLSPGAGDARRPSLAVGSRSFDDDIAVIGMAGRFPGAHDLHTFWRNLRDGVESITFFGDGELEDVDQNTAAAANYVPARGVLAHGEDFDAAFFGFTPREAEVMDPQHRVFLEVSHHALEDAGYDPGRYGGRIGLYAGVGLNTYLMHVGKERLTSRAGGYQAFIANDKDFVPTRVSYKLDLRGPSVNVQTACSSSLVAVHLACQSLRAGESDMALAGGVTVHLPQRQGYLHEDGGILSPDGHCRAFDERGGGTVLGNGLGVVVLKPLASARRDGDRVLALIKGSAINNDGALKMGYTAPSVEGQAEVLATALAQAGVAPETVDYIEAHGTGTALGDPIEVTALRQVYEAAGRRSAPRYLGAVKSNIGHLDTAAGIAGLIKTVLALQHREIPPSLHFSRPNPKVPFDGSSFEVAAERKPWARNGTPRRAGVSSFGIGGTNVHMVLEEAPEDEAVSRAEAPPWQLVTLSAKTPTALDQITKQLAEHLEALVPAEDDETPTVELADVAFTLHTGRQTHDHRRYAVVRDLADAAQVLGQVDPERVRTATTDRRGRATDSTRELVFLFSGQGSQYPEMGRALYDSEPVFRDSIDRAADILESHLGADLRRLLFPPATDEAAIADAARQLTETRVTQPALFAVEVALARLWEAWGVRPTAMIGHSIGEFVAAYLAGVFSFEDAMGLVAERGRLMQERPTGSMLAVGLPEDEVLPWLGDELSLAVLNGPNDAVVAGPEAAIEALEARLAAGGEEIRQSRLHTSHAFHSSMMAPAVEPFVQRVAEIGPQTPQIPFTSNVTGTWITDEQASDPAYWGRQLAETVRFADGLRVAAERAPAAWLEVGPGNTLANLARSQTGGAPSIASLPHARDPEDARRFLLGSTGRLWQVGVDIDWQAFYARRDEKRHRVTLPTYPFERRRFWLERGQPTTPTQTSDPLSKQRDVANWFFAPVWKPCDPTATTERGAEIWWVVGDAAPGSLTAGLAERLTEAGQRVETLAKGAEIDQRIVALETAPTRVLAAWPADGDNDRLATMLPLVQALDKMPGDSSVSLELVTRGAWSVRGGEAVDPDAALLWGFLQAVPQELPRLRCRSIDLEPGLEINHALDDLAAELLGSPTDVSETAWREGLRWHRSFEPVRLPEPPSNEPPSGLRAGGTYLITGGLGGVGLALARGLVETLQPAIAREPDAQNPTPVVRLALLGRTGLPPQSTSEAPLSAAARQRIEAIRELETAGAEVVTLAADVADREALRTAITEIENRWGKIHGVLHAAGVAGGGLLRLRRPAEAETVLRPKIDGTRHLLEEVKAPDFLLLCSSINAVAGGYGQADYCAANAFLDATAAATDDRRGRRILALGWDRWRGVGMAASVAGGHDGDNGGHPLLGHPFFSSAEREIYRARYTVDEHWVLSEHLIAGRPTVPGATYLEMARAALAKRVEDRMIEVRDVLFLEPLAVDLGASREVLTVLDLESMASKNNGADTSGIPNLAATFRVLSRPAGGGESPWSEHCRGRVAAVAPRPTPALDLGEVRNRTAGRITADDVAARSSRGFLVTGRRWQGLESVRTGDGELMAEIVLDGELAGDLDDYPLHPALLDVAVGCVQFAREGDYLPFSYDLLEVHGPLPGRLISHLTLHDGSDDAVTCDALLVDEDGVLRARVEGFSMRRLASATIAELERAAVSPASDDADAPEGPLRPVDAVLEGTIEPTEAIDVVRRVLNGRVPPHLVVSPRDLAAVRAAYADFDPTRLLTELAELETPTATQDRPDLGTAFVAPEAGMEKVVAEVWQRFLGIESIGIHDNFFELGGTSLVGVQVVGELKRRLDREISTVSLFEAPTVAALAELLEPREGTAPAFQRTRDRASKKKAALSRRKRPPRRRARTKR